MTGIIGISDKRVTAKLKEKVESLGQYAALSYAQRCAGTKETGTLSPTDVEQINSHNADNFLRRYALLCETHAALQERSKG